MGKKKWEDVIISDNNVVLGKKIIKTLGGVKVICKSQNVLVGAKWRVKAPNELKKIAYKLGANAIINAGFRGIRDQHLYYNGTAVVIEDEE
ncbi:MAG: hypothetical protein ACFE85_02795 [Candidatus Hodarchaeota archaeon]